MNRRDFMKQSAVMWAAAGAAPNLRAQAGETGWKAGFAERDITPEIGSEKPGGYGKSYNQKFHNPCKVRAGVFDDGTRRVALVGVDSLIIPRPVVLGAREQIRHRCGIDPRGVLVSASHTHSGGPVGMVQPGQYDHASALVQELAYGKSSMADAAYLKRVEAEIVAAVCEADARRVSAFCCFGSGHEDKAAYNRRFRMKNGQSWTHPGKGNPDIIEPAGPIDPEVGVIGAWDQHGNLLGSVVNFACHATTGPGGISADWIYFMELTIQGVFGKDANVVFLTGASGDITQVDNLSPYVPVGDQYAKIVGGRVGAEAVKVLWSTPRGSAAQVDMRQEVLNIPKRKPSPERVRQSLELVQKDPQVVGVTEWTFAKEIVMLDAQIQKEPAAEVEVQAVQVGPSVFVTNPAEYFCQFGLDIKAGSKFPFTYPVELANGIVGYVATEEALGKNGGGYETRLSSYSNLELKAGRTMADTGIRLANQMSPGAVPKFQAAPPFQGPWSYGNVPPELS